MKLIAFLLSAYISFLMLQPACVEVSIASTENKTSQHDCCKQKKETQKHGCESKSENKCANGVCNPFGECTCCLAISPLPFYSFRSVSFTKEKIVVALVGLQSNYIADCFHPPEHHC